MNFQIKSRFFLPIFLAFFFAALSYLHNDILIDIADEGFLWYGSLQTLRGHVPIRDFQAYDPGRYYWCAALFSVFGNGLMSLRLAAGFFQWLGLCFGLLALKRVIKSTIFLAGAGLLSVFWMLSSFRYFDASLPLITLFFAARLVEKPSFRRHLVAGIWTGLAAFFGRNHGFYAMAAFGGLSLFLEWKGCLQNGFKKRCFLVLGAFAGLIPLWVLCAAAPGFGESYFKSFWETLVLFGQGQSNKAILIHWPWLVQWSSISARLPTTSGRALEYLNRFSIGFLITFVIVYYSVMICAVIRLKKIQEPARALFAASVFVGSVYLHHIFSRPDVHHLGEGIFPVLAGLLALQFILKAPILKRIVLGVEIFFFVASFFAAALLSNIVFKHMVPKGGMVSYEIGKDRIQLIHSQAVFCEEVQRLAAQFMAPGDSILLAPLMTTFYCVLDKTSPTYEIYFYSKPQPELEKKSVQELDQKKVRWALVSDFWIDGRQENSLSHSHPLLWDYLMTHFEILTYPEGLQYGYSLLRRKS